MNFYEFLWIIKYILYIFIHVVCVYIINYALISYA